MKASYWIDYQQWLYCFTILYSLAVNSIRNYLGTIGIPYRVALVFLLNETAYARTQETLLNWKCTQGLILAQSEGSGNSVTT